MKRWITLFVSFAVFVSAFSLGVFADDPDLDIQDIYVFASIVSSQTYNFAVEIPQQGQITDRLISLNYNQPYTKIKNFSFTCPASSYFLIDFDIIGDDRNNIAPNINPSVSAGRQITTYVSTDFSVSGSNGSPTIFRAEVRHYQGNAGFVHFSIFGVNDTLDTNNIIITYTNPVICTAGTIPATGEYFNQRITNVNCKSSLSIDVITNLMEEVSQTLTQSYFEIVSIGDTLGNFYNEFHLYWNSIYNSITHLNTIFFNNRANAYTGVTIGSDGSVTLKPKASYNYMYSIISNLNTLIELQGHQLELENKAAEAGANDTYDSLNDSASFGDLTDFAGAGSAASWSSGSFVNGLDQTWSWFSTENKNMIDAVTPNRDEIYISIYDDTLEEYNRILGGD